MSFEQSKEKQLFLKKRNIVIAAITIMAVYLNIVVINYRNIDFSLKNPTFLKNVVSNNVPSASKHQWKRKVLILSYSR